MLGLVYNCIPYLSNPLRITWFPRKNSIPSGSQGTRAIPKERSILMADVFGTGTFAAIDDTVLRTRSRAEFVYESLRDAISDGRIAGGERVREEEIARNLGVSRTPVRE